TSWEHHQVTPHRFVQSAACRTARVQKSGASAASSTLSGAPISCSHTLRSGSVANAPDSSVRYSACRMLCGDIAPYFWAVPLTIQVWIAVTAPRREAWAGSKGCSSRYQTASYSACRASRWSCSGIAPSRESSQSPACWGVARMGGWVGVAGELVDLVAERERDVGGQIREGFVQTPGQLDLRLDHLGIGEHVASVP